MSSEYQRSLPYEWTVQTVMESSKLIMDYRGRTPRKLGMEWGGGRIPALSARNVRMGQIDFSEECHLASESLYQRWMTSGDMQRGDILITTEAPLGNIAAVPDERKYILSQRTVLLRPNTDLFDPLYFLKFLQSSFFQRSLSDNATGSTALGIQRKRLEKLLVLRPPMLEQRRIGLALEDTDQLINATKGLIAKKQAIKHGMMQELLGGWTRLPGYSGEWAEAKLNDVCLVDPESLPATTPKSVLIDYISLEDVSRGVLLGSSRLLFRDAPSRARRLVRRGDVLFGTVRPNLQSHVHYTGQLANPVASTGFAVLRPISGCSDSSFIGQWVLSDEAMGQVNRIIAGSNYPAVSSRDVRRFDVRLPGVVEQRHIGDTLGITDKEIAALEARLRKVRLVKRGMMQELLTGRTRLVPREVSA